MIRNAHQIEIAPGVTRNDIMTFATLGQARAAANDRTRRYRVPVVLGDPESARPYWVPATPRIGGKLVAAGYEYA